MIQAEYERLTIERRASALSAPRFSGWYVECSWVLTGERRRYNSGTFAFDAPPVDGVRGGEQRIVAAGVNWYLNPAIRFMLDYQHVEIDRLSPNPATFLTPVGAEIGQKYNVLSLRSQLAF